MELSHTGFCTVLDHTVDGQHTQQALIDALIDLHERWLSHRAGYQSTQFLASIDGAHVLSIVRWNNESAFRAFEASPDNATVMADIQQTLSGLAGLSDTRINRFRLRHQVSAGTS
ncbi:antibiotic biosynthesis monooxygenase [Micromonospora endophytica]|uniref:Uncharacterized protein n=1 Tax=Micromonospora endophytica TaxID=515350 RepID=A0A2W2CRK5_9ACTN|nr:antibiotic biosynthesis monooxygenase [Micromonospora endophytica]PZG01223.1 hypothetical protein C1I93_00480 [Micromonospora endophytica]RIW45836.1 hypothetical protein D3H59_14100 [Micromonospora endophytica]BCJ61903.1 hypothetical protein Jiend_53250 [Micromonospora endophytica]